MKEKESELIITFIWFFFMQKLGFYQNNKVVENQLLTFPHRPFSLFLAKGDHK